MKLHIWFAGNWTCPVSKKSKLTGQVWRKLNMSGFHVIINLENFGFKLRGKWPRNSRWMAPGIGSLNCRKYRGVPIATTICRFFKHSFVGSLKPQVSSTHSHCQPYSVRWVGIGWRKSPIFCVYSTNRKSPICHEMGPVFYQKSRIFIQMMVGMVWPRLIGIITHCNTLQHTATHCNTL